MPRARPSACARRRLEFEPQADVPLGQLTVGPRGGVDVQPRTRAQLIAHADHHRGCARTGDAPGAVDPLLLRHRRHGQADTDRRAAGAEPEAVVHHLAAGTRRTEAHARRRRQRPGPRFDADRRIDRRNGRFAGCIVLRCRGQTRHAQCQRHDDRRCCAGDDHGAADVRLARCSSTELLPSVGGALDVV